MGEKIGSDNTGSVRLDDDVLYFVFEFTDISRPIVPGQDLQRLIRERHGGTGVSTASFLDEVAGHEADIGPA